MAKPNDDKMTLEELDAEIVRLQNEEAPKAERLRATAAYDRAFAQAEVQRKLGTMSDAEKAALAQYVKADGIGSDEASGR